MDDSVNPFEVRPIFQNDLIQDQLNRLDPDLAVRVVMSGVSLSVSKMLKELSLANQIMLFRFIQKEKNGKRPFTEAEQKKLDGLQAMFMQNYTAKGSVPN
jgi:hypothetical protein